MNYDANIKEISGNGKSNIMTIVLYFILTSRGILPIGNMHSLDTILITRKFLHTILKSYVSIYIKGD